MKKILYSSQKKYLDSLRIEQDPLIQEMELFASESKIPILNSAAADFLEQVILMHRPKNVLEIGMAIGYSSIRVARKLRSKASIDTIEISKQNISTAKIL